MTYKCLHYDEYFADGQKDAEKGIYAPPHTPDDEDEDIELGAENGAYRDGFSAKRREMGDGFKWA